MAPALERISSWLTLKKAILLIFLIGFLVYFNAAFNGFVWDDEEQILNNTIVHSISNLPSFFLGSTFNTGGSGGLGGLYYKPMMTVFFSLLYTFFGPNPFPFHLFQITLHLINAVLVFLLFKELFSRGKKEQSNLFPFALSLIFLLHPINTEAVIYSASLQDTLFLFFGLWAFLLTIKKELKPLRVLSVSALLLLSLLSKETGVVFIPIIGIYLLLFRRKTIIPYLVCLILSLSAYSWLRFAVAGVFFRTHSFAPITRLPLADRLMNLPKIFFYYVRTFFFPNNLAISQHWVVNNIGWADFYLPLILVIMTSAFLIGQALFLYQSKNQYFKLHLFFSSWFILGISAHLQIIPLDMTVAERWFYLPVVGMISVLGITLSLLEKRLNMVLALLIVILVALSVRTFVRTLDWRNGLTLYSHDIQISKGAFDLENNYGVELFRAGRITEAGVHFENSVNLAPDWWTNWNNLGAVMEQQQKLKEAEQDYQKAIDNGEYYLAYENLANILFKEDPKAAKKFSEDSLKKLPYNPKLWFILSLSDYKLNLKDEATQAALNAYQLAPSDQTYYLYSALKSGQDLKLQ